MERQTLQELARREIEQTDQVVVADGCQKFSGRVDRDARDDGLFLLLRGVCRRQFNHSIGGDLGNYRCLGLPRRDVSHAGEPQQSERNWEEGFQHIYHLKWLF